MTRNLFPKIESFNKRVYAYIDTNPQYKGLIRIGQTTRQVEIRVREQYPTVRPGADPFQIVINESAMRPDGTTFSDYDIFKYLEKKKVQRPKGDFFRCNVDIIKAAILAVKNRIDNDELRTCDFKMRPEQEAAVNKSYNYFNKNKINKDPNHTLRFLWNAKMRFGKTFAAYQLAKRMNWKRVLILTYLPAVQNAWKDDLTQHIDFKDWQFISNDGLSINDIKKNKPYVCFGSFQDYLGKSNSGNIKKKNQWAHEINWDCIILDEYHFGSWNNKTKEIYDTEEKEEYNELIKLGVKDIDLNTIPLTTDHYLYLSGTPFRALESGEFIEEQIFNWTYPDEQKAKYEWKNKNNPYLSMPRIVMFTYKLPENIRKIAAEGEFDEFDLNEFFSANGQGSVAKFKHISEVQKWLELIKGNFEEVIYENLRQGSAKPPMPFSDHRLKNQLNHTVWFLPNVTSCYAMANLLIEAQNIFFKDYKIIIAAGSKAGIGVKALPPVLKAMEPSPLEAKTITLTCRKLLTGVTIKPWTGIFMLQNTSSAQTYFQSAFRVQSPWVEINEKKEEIILKKECYVFDFSPNRTLRLVSDYCKLNTDINSTPEKKIDEFLKFLPILSYNGFGMDEVNADDVLEIADIGTTSTLLAKKWIYDGLLNVDNSTLQRILDDPMALEVLMKIEGFRDIKNDIETIINKTQEIKDLKRKKAKEEVNDKQILSEAEREYKNKKDMIKKKLKQFISRIPIFMYLTDYREKSLEDVITKLQPKLFKKVTGLETSDFNILVQKGVFNKPLLNSAIRDFKKYEEPSLNYYNTHIGLYDTVVKKKDYNPIFINQS